MRLHAFLETYAQSDVARFHMPGHKGRAYAPASTPSPADWAYAYDLTEIHGADSLYAADGVIAEAERRATAVYGTRATVFSAGGSTLCIQAMLLHTLRRGDRLICGRGAHVALHNALALFGLLPYWVYPERVDAAGVGGVVTPAQIEAALQDAPDARAVYITSPDYMGVRSDVAGIAAVCHAHCVPLLVDNAHGAHLKCCSPDLHPIDLGADLCCDSAHKTLPVLTGGAYLHAAHADAAALKAAMAMTGSTSPSYLILDSLDRCTDFLEREAGSAFAKLEVTHARLTEAAASSGFSPILQTDCTKLSLHTEPAGISAPRFAAWLRTRGIECEYAAGGQIVFLMTPLNSPSDFARLEDAFAQFRRRAPLASAPFCYPRLEAACPPEAAFFAEKETVPVEQASGRIAAQAPTLCPPGVPVVSFGERITPETAILLKNSGFSCITVVK